MTTQPSSPFQVGDYVRVGDSALTWKILAITDGASANGPLYTLESGQSGRRSYVTIEHLTLFPYNEPRRLTS